MQAGVDLRIIVMLRDPLALLASTVLKRHFVESAEIGMEVLLRNFEVGSTVFLFAKVTTTSVLVW